jgi:adenylate cyclase
VGVKNRTYIQLTTLLALALVVVLYYARPGLLENFEDKTYDMRVRVLRQLFAPVTATDIAIVAIDDKSIAEIGRFPWSRHYYADFLERATRAGAKAVLFDAFFPEEQAAPVDGKFAAAVRLSGRTTLAGAFEFAGDGSIIGFRENIPVLQRVASRIAHINVLPDDDGVIRWTRVAIPYRGRYYPSLGLSGAAELLGVREFTPGNHEVVVGPRRIPTDGEQRMLINFSGKAGVYERFSFVDVVKGRVGADRLRGRVLFVGATALGIYDMRITPFDNNMPGVEVNANVADNIRRGDFVTRGVIESLLDIAFIIVLGLATAFVTLKLSHGASLPLVSLLVLGYALIAGYLFHAGRWVSVVYPVMSILVSFAITAYLRFFFFDRKAREIRAMFSSYVSPKVVNELVKNPELARVGGESREITVLFADVKNYTSYSERRTPREVVRILNDYLAEMTHIIMEYDGTLDKFLGDGILAYWNAPLQQENHAELAVRCAVAMIDRMGPLQKKWLREGDEPLSWGIGINTGEVIVGSVGAEGKKMEYTAIGDNVNLTYRIQNESREAGCPVITRALYDRVQEMVEVQSIGSVLVKGRRVPVEVYALKGLRPGVPAV